MFEKFLFRSFVVVAALTVMASASVARADTFHTGGNAFDIDFVPISGSTNPTVEQANAGDLDGFGIVNNDYRMGVHEITNDQWDKFVAAYGAVTGDPASAYDGGPDWTGTNVPANRVSWYEAAQLVNWLNTSTGHQAAYKFTGTQGTGDYAFVPWTPAEAAGGTNLYRHKNAFYFLPTEHEWVKAAYWNGATLQHHATKDNSDPVAWRPTGGPNSDGQAAGWNLDHGNPDNSLLPDEPWDVTAGYSPEELNGTYDMMGNAWEWLESPYGEASYDAGSSRGVRGRYWGNYSNYLHVSDSYASPANENDILGFRVASIPEPGSITLLICGLLGCLIWWRCRK